MRNGWLGYTAALLAMACGGSDSKTSSSGTAIQCAYAAGYCLTLRAPTFSSSQLTALQGECTGDGGTYATGACPATNAVAGTCTMPASIVTTPVAGLTIAGTFYTPNFNATTAPPMCSTLTGTWSGGGGGGGGGGGASVLSCTFAGVGCSQLNAASFDATTISNTNTGCTGVGGTFAQAACATAGTVGSCVYPASGGITERFYYSSTSWTVATAQADCADVNSPGTWTP